MAPWTILLGGLEDSPHRCHWRGWPEQAGWDDGTAGIGSAVASGTGQGGEGVGTGDVGVRRNCRWSTADTGHQQPVTMTWECYLQVGFHHIGAIRNISRKQTNISVHDRALPGGVRWRKL
jgi:hypothetical protein